MENTFTTSASSRRASLPVPPLDEDTLAGGLSNPFGSSGYVLVPGDDGNNYLAQASNLTSPSAGADSPTALSVLQQQVAAQLEQEYVYTRSNLQQCSRSVLLAIVTSLLDDCPAAMTGEIRLRMERAMNSRGHSGNGGANGNPVNSPNATTTRSAAGGSGRRGSLLGNNNAHSTGSAAALGVNAMPWTPNSHAKQSAGASLTSPYRNSNNNSATGQSSPSSHRKGGGRNQKTKDDDQELCSVHNSMRALKHLQRNPSTGLYECIHGFHCLVDAPSEPSGGALASGLRSPKNADAMTSRPPAVPRVPASKGYSVANFFDAPPPSAEQFHLCYVSADHHSSPDPAVESSESNPPRGTYFDANSVNEDDLNQLEDLLQSVRDGMRDD